MTSSHLLTHGLGRNKPPRYSGPMSALRSHPCGAVSSAQVWLVYSFVDLNDTNICTTTVSRGITTLVLGQLRWPVLK